jgi:hypothetical protein
MDLTMHVIQCLLKNNNQYTTRWVLSKKAKQGETIHAYEMYDNNVYKEWTIDTVYSLVEIDEKFVYHAIL